MNKKDGVAIQDERDPERAVKLRSCCDLLLAGGYFRARIVTLSPFDRVVGGLVWSIVSSGTDVDVDIIFKENESIGARIRVSDQICFALTQMKGPALQAQQIQGLDYDSLFPVIQWLVRKVIENRRLTGDLIRLQSINEFNRNYSALPSEVFPVSALSSAAAVFDTCGPLRQFRKKAGAEFTSSQARVQATLLEYGEKIGGAPAAGGDDNSSEQASKTSAARSALKAKFEGSASSSSSTTSAAAAAAAAAAEAEAKEKELLSQLQTAAGSSARVSGVNVGSLLSLHGDSMRSALDAYNVNSAAAASTDASSSASALAPLVLSAEQMHARLVEQLQKKIANAKAEYEAGQPKDEEEEREVREAIALLEKKNKYKQRIIDETEKLDAAEKDPKNKEMLAKLRRLVMLNESLKTQEQEFKDSCRAQREQLLAQIAGIEKGEGDAEAQRMLEIEGIYEADTAKLNKIRRALAKKNQEIAKCERAIDDVPTRAELLQYERRFVELYELVAAKLVETKKYYNMYNTLEESLRYMQNEVSLLNSIIEGFPKAMTSKVGKESFLEQMSKILDGVGKSKALVQSELDSATSGKDEVQAKYAGLLEKQRNYFKAVKEFQEECTKNEQLLALVSQE